MAQQGILSLSIKDRQALYRSYMPFVSGGGLFVPSTKKFSLGDEVFLLLLRMLASGLVTSLDEIAHLRLELNDRETRVRKSEAALEKSRVGSSAVG